MLVVSKYSLDPILQLLDNPPVAQSATPESGEQNPPKPDPDAGAITAKITIL